MKKKVFYIALLCFSVQGLSAVAQVLKSDLTLLKGAPVLDAEEYVDPYWDLAWHGKVASYGDPESQFLVAQIYEQGKLVPRDLKKALSYYKKAAEQKHVESCMKLGQIYADNTWVKADEEQSLFWYRRAAEQGYVQAQIQMSHLLEARKQYMEATEWMEKAMRQMFPNEPDLTRVSPDLERLSRLKGKVL